MKKYLSFVLLCAAVLFTSCKEHNYAEDMTGRYSFTETGKLTINGTVTPTTVTGSFTVSLSGANRLFFKGDFTGSGNANKYGTGFWIDDDTDDITTAEGVRIHYDNSYFDGKFYGSSMSWTTQSVVTATYNGMAMTGVYQSTTSAHRK